MEVEALVQALTGRGVRLTRSASLLAACDAPLENWALSKKEHG